MATITKTPSGTWKAMVRRKNWPTQIKTFRIKKDCEDWARRTEDEIVRGVYLQRTSSERTTLREALDRYLKEVSITKKQTTYKNEKISAKTIASTLGNYSLSSITPNMVGNYRDQRLAEGKSKNTVRIELALLSHLYNTAIKEWGMGVVFNPVSNIRKPSPGPGRMRRLNGDEEQRLLKACDAHSNPMLGWIVRLALYTAMRLGEIRNLKRRDVNLSRRLITLTDTKNKSARVIPLSDNALKVIQRAMDNPIRPIDSDLLFFGEPGKDGKRMPYVTSKIFRQIVKDTGLDDFRFHDLRHEATSRFVEAGLSDQEVASITGHKSMQMLKRYTHLRTEDLVQKIRSI